MLVRPGGGREGAVLLLRGPWGTFHSSWDSEAWLWEMGPGDQVDFMSVSLPEVRRRQNGVGFWDIMEGGSYVARCIQYMHIPRSEMWFKGSD